MIIFRLVKNIYTGESKEIDGDIIPADFTTIPPIECADDEVVLLNGDTQTKLKKTDQTDEEVVVAERDLSPFRHHKITELELRRTQLEREGCPFVFGDVGDIIQTRDDRDLININGVATTAILMKTAGVTDPSIMFRAASDTSYLLTPDEALELGRAVAARSVQLYAIQWELKDAVAAAQSVEEINAIKWPEN
jgi:hypothetical protein